MAEIQVDYIDHMGDDLTVVNSARVSFDKESDWDYSCEQGDATTGEFSLRKEDEKLIKYLATHGHWTPFSHPQITLRETVPIFVAHQRFKHRVGFTYTEQSRHAPEQARMVLPQSMMTSYYVTGSLSAFVRMVRQRTDSHAQVEIQELAQKVSEIIEPLFPVSWAALVDGV